MKKLLFLFVFTLTSNFSYAGIFVEPILGLNLGGNSEESGLTGLNFEYDYSGTMVGLRAGMSMAIFNFGLTYDTGSIERELTSPQSTVDSANSSGVSLKSEYDTTNIGLFVGADLPLVRGWVSYFISSKLEATTNNLAGALGDSGDEYSGSGYSLGIGVKVLPYISLNVERRQFTYDEVKTSAGTFSLPSIDAAKGEMENSEFVLSVSIPLTF